MFTNPEQFASATKTLFELQMMTFNALTSKTMKGVEQVVALNMQTAKNSIDSALARGKQLSEAATPKDAADIAGGVRPDAAGAIAYGNELIAIIDEIRSEFNEAADHHLAEAKITLTALIQDLTENVKPGSENAVQVMKTAIETAFNGYEQVTQATRQAVKSVEEQIAKATEKVTTGAPAPAAS